VAIAVNVVAGFFALRGPAPERGRLLLGAALLGFSTIHYALSRFDSGHVFNAALVSFMLLPLSISVLFFSFVTKPLPSWRKVMFLITVALVAARLLKLEPHEAGIFVAANGRSFPLAKSRAPAAEQMLAELQRVSMPGQLLFVGPADLRRTLYCDTWIYHIFPQLPPATYFLEMNVASVDAPSSRLAHDVARADWLVLDRAWDFIVEPNRSSEFGPDEPNNVVRTEFDLWKEYGPYLVLRHKRLRNLIEQQPPQG
jgi:hypothetical protein